MKKFTVLGVVALVLAMVSSAFAVNQWPYQAMNKTWSVMGFSVNGTTLGAAIKHEPAVTFNSTVFKRSAAAQPQTGGGWSTFQNHYAGGTGVSAGNLTQNGTSLFANGLEYGWNATIALLNHQASGKILVNVNGPNAQPRGIMTVGLNSTAYTTRQASASTRSNSSITYYVLPVSGYNLMFGLALNSSGKMTLGKFNSTSSAYGASFLAFQGRDKADTSTGANTTLDIKNTNLGTAGASTWSFFGVSPYAPVLGTIQFNASSSGSVVKFMNGTTQFPGNYSILVDNTYKRFGLKKLGRAPFENATLTCDNSTFIGINRNGTFVIGLKDAVQGSSSDYFNRYFNVLGVGYTSTRSAAGGNRSFAMLGSVKVDASGYIVGGNTTTQNGTSISISRYSTTRTSTDNNRVRFASVSKLNGVATYRAYDNVTISNNTAATNSSYVVVWEKNKKFALGLSQFNTNTKQAALLILLPKFATEGAFEAQNGPDGSVVTTPDLYNKYAAIGSNWANYEVVKKRFGTQLNGFTPVGTIRSFNATVTTAGSTGRNYTQYRYSLSNWGGDVSTLRLKKLILKGNANLFSGQTADTVMDFNYSTAGSTSTDGIWWVSAGSNVVQPGQIIDTNDGTATYYVNFVIRDNGAYDGNKTSKYITDPQILGTVVPGGSSSSSSTGCVFNPTAGFGLEWLLLLIAPALGIVRSRLKK